MKAKCIAVLALAASLANPVQVLAKDLSGDYGSSLLTSLVVGYGVSYVADLSGNLIVKSIEVSGEGTTIVLRSVSTGVERTLQFSGRMAKDLSQATGESARLMAIGSGHLLVASGKVLAFIPNEIGKSLLYSGTVAQRSESSNQPDAAGAVAR